MIRLLHYALTLSEQKRFMEGYFGVVKYALCVHVRVYAHLLRTEHTSARIACT